MKPSLTKEENEVYLKIVQKGDMDMMFDLGYSVGRVHASKEMLEMVQHSKDKNIDVRLP